MAQSFVQLASDGSGKKIDTQVTTSAAQHRQVMSIGDPSTDANVAPVDATNGLTVKTSNGSLETGGNLAAAKADLDTIVTNTANQTNGAQLTKLFDGSNVIGTTAHPVQSQIGDGTNVANVVANDSSYNGVPVNNSTKVLTFTTSSTGAQNLLANTDVRGYGSVEVILTSVGGGLAWNGQFSPNSGGTYISANTWLNRTSSTGVSTALGILVNTLYQSNTVGAYFQLTLSAMTSGTTSGYVILSALPTPPTVMNVGATSSTGNAVPANAFYMGIDSSGGNLVGLMTSQGQSKTANAGGTSISSSLLLYNGTTFDVALSGGVTGMAGVSLQASSSGGWSFTNISTSTTTTVKSGAGTFHLCCVNTLGTVSSTCTFYDNTAGSGTVIAIINSLTLSGSFTFDIAFATGLTVVTTGTAAPNITVAYK